LALDFGTPPQPVEEDDHLRDREVPKGPWNAFALTPLDQEDTSEITFGDFCGDQANLAGPLRV
jgi:hypothetical protein